jgi:hypothetical protein
MFTVRRASAHIAALVVAGSLGAAAVAPAVAGARLWDSDFLPIYTLSKAERGRVCGNFGGTISYSDGYSVNCSSGDVFYSSPSA